MSIEIRGCKREAFCDKCSLKRNNCPIDQTLGDLTHDIPFSQAKQIMTTHGLTENRDHLSGLPEDVVEDVVENLIFVVNCTSGPIKDTNYTSCGSIFVKNNDD